jgi:hypothetical protein
MATARSKRERSVTEERPPHPDQAVDVTDDSMDFSEEILQEYSIIPGRAQGTGFLPTFVRLLSNQRNRPLTREAIQAEFEAAVGRPPAKATLDHLLQAAVRAKYLAKMRRNTTGERVWIAPASSPTNRREDRQHERPPAAVAPSMGPIPVT